MVRQIVGHELLGLWDYEGKLESKRWNPETMERVIRSRLTSPPAKILRALAFPAFEFLLTKFYIPPVEENHFIGVQESVGKTESISYSPLELKANVGSAAATADHAGVK